MELNNLLKLDLKEHCLFCLKPTTLENVSEEENKLIQLIFEQSADGRFNSFQRFFWKVLSGVSVNGGRVGEKVGGNLLVCRKCIIILKEIKRLHSNLEITQMLLVEKMEDLQMVVKNTNQGGREVEGLSLSELKRLKDFQENVVNQGQTGVKICGVCLGHCDVDVKEESSETGLEFEDFAIDDSPLPPSYADDRPQTDEEVSAEIKHEFEEDLISDSEEQDKDWDCDWESEDEEGQTSSEDEMSESEDEILPAKRRKRLEDVEPESLVGNSACPDPSNLVEIEMQEEPLPSMNFEHSQFCDLCHDEVPNTEIFNHLQGHVKDYAIACVNPECPRVFSCKLNWMLHIGYTKSCDDYASAHGISTELKCPVCTFMSMDVPAFREHLNDHELAGFGDKRIPCPVPDCNEKFSFRESVDLHISYHNLRVKTAQQKRKEKRLQLVKETEPEATSSLESSTHLPKRNRAEVEKARPRSLKTNVMRQVPKTISEHYQICDLCYEEVPNAQILSHLQCHVKDYVVPCVNPNCPRYFSCKGKWRLHLKTNPTCNQCARSSEDSLEFKCPVCIFKNKMISSFWGHLKVHELAEGNKQMPCPIPDCLEKFSFRESVDLHIFYGHNLPPPSSDCSICHERIEVVQMSEHLMEVHQILEPVKCKQCSFVFAKKEDHIDHLFENHKKDLFGAICDICEDGIKICHLKSFRKHYFNVHQIGTGVEDPTTFICEHCSREFSTFMGLKIHEAHAHPQEELQSSTKKRKQKLKGFVCTICPQKTVFNTNELLLTHNIACHGAELLKCKSCGETFNDAGKLRRHVRNHAGLDMDKQKIWKCESSGCDKVFKSSNALHIHHRHQHFNPTGEVFTCDRCGKEYSTEMKLKEHVKTAHAEASHTCETCGESFKSLTVLRRHKLIHTGERPHICPICGQAFRHRDVMGRHIKAHEQKGDNFKPSGPMKQVRKRVVPK